MPKVTYASFNGLSTPIVRRPDGGTHATVFTPRDDPRWPKAAVRSALRQQVRQAVSAASSPRRSEAGAVSPTTAASPRSDVKLSAVPDARLSLQPFAVSSPGRDAGLKWTGAQVAGIDWQDFVILPAEPPPAPPTSLKERLSIIFRVENEGGDVSKQASRVKPETDRDDYYELEATHKLENPTKTLAERIDTCPTHRQPRVVDQVEVRTLLQQHLRLNKNTGTDIHGEDTFAPHQKKLDDVVSDNSDSSGVSVLAGSASWEISDPRYLAQERDRLARKVKDLEADLTQARGVGEQRTSRLRGEVRRLRRALEIPADSDEEGFEDANADLANRMKATEALLGQREEYDTTESEAEESEDWSASEATFTSTARRSRQSRSRRRAGSTLRRNILGASSKGPQLNADGDLLWAERQLGFMGLHRGNAHLRRKDVEDHMAVLWKNGRRRDAYDANKAMEILCNYAVKEQQDVTWAETVLAGYGLHWIDIDMCQEQLEAAIDKLRGEGRDGDAADLRRAGEIALGHQGRRLHEATQTLSEFGADEKNFITHRTEIQQMCEDLRNEGRLGRAKDIWQAYTDLRRRRRAVLRESNKRIYEIARIGKDLPWLLREQRCQKAADQLQADGREEDALHLLNCLKEAEVHHVDASEWARIAFQCHSVPVSGPDKRQRFVDKTRELKMQNTRKSLRQRRDLDLAREILAMHRWQEERLLDSDLDQDPHPKKQAHEFSVDQDHPRYKSKTIEREVQRMLDEGEFTKNVSQDTGKTVFQEAKTGKIVFSLDDVAVARLDRRGAFEDYDEPDSEEDVPEDMEFDLGGGDAPFAQMMLRELRRLESEGLVGVTEDDKVKLARDRAKAQVDLNRTVSTGTLVHEGLKRTAASVSDTLATTPTIGPLTPAERRLARRNINEQTFRTLKDGKLQAEAQRMVATGEWVERKDLSTGRVRFVRSATGEVSYDLLQVAEDRLRSRGELPMLTAYSDGESISDSDDVGRVLAERPGVEIGSSRIHRAFSRKLSKELERRRSSQKLGFNPTARAMTRTEAVAAEADRLLHEKVWLHGVDANTGKLYFVHSKTGQVEETMAEEARKSLQARGQLPPEEADLVVEDVPVRRKESAAGDFLEASGQRRPAVRSSVLPCPSCTGTGRIGKRECGMCGGRGKVVFEETAEEMRPAAQAGQQYSSDSDDSVIAASAPAARIGAAVDKGGRGRLKLFSKGEETARIKRGELLRLLRAVDPERLHEADELLAAWQGREAECVAAVLQEYKQGRPPSPSRRSPEGEGSPRRRARAERMGAERRDRVIADALAVCHSPRRLRHLLIRLYAAEAPDRLANVRMQTQSTDPEALLQQLVSEFGEARAAAAWVSEPPQEALGPAALYAKDQLVDDALRDFVGAGDEDSVRAQQLSPLFRLSPPAQMLRRLGSPPRTSVRSPSAAAQRVAEVLRKAAETDQRERAELLSLVTPRRNRGAGPPARPADLEPDMPQLRAELPPPPAPEQPRGRRQQPPRDQPLGRGQNLAAWREPGEPDRAEQLGRRQPDRAQRADREQLGGGGRQPPGAGLPPPDPAAPTAAAAAALTLAGTRVDASPPPSPDSLGWDGGRSSPLPTMVRVSTSEVVPTVRPNASPRRNRDQRGSPSASPYSSPAGSPRRGWGGDVAALLNVGLPPPPQRLAAPKPAVPRKTPPHAEPTPQRDAQPQAVPPDALVPPPDARAPPPDALAPPPDATAPQRAPLLHAPALRHHADPNATRSGLRPRSGSAAAERRLSAAGRRPTAASLRRE
eukprot:TRINITY_DN18348_c0_g1_i1.p1 TRINITY_DN18348_c0_g1~~TRINITY_DN18348_c0_g1_i1.p1  ORF type:complete len:1779 (+),score=553.65 TRINITY_DN18348_c0_g1_i1:32-5338(+)